jgi:anaerobic ribonucleoside-triphosphate reductase
MNSKKCNPNLNTVIPERTKCLVYTRVMGYHRPVESFNIGKKGEHKQRVYFKEQPATQINL